MGFPMPVSDYELSPGAPILDVCERISTVARPPDVNIIRFPLTVNYSCISFEFIKH